MKGARTAAKTMGARDWALLVLLSVLWGGAFFFGEIALAELPPFSVALLRVGIAAMVLSLAVRIAGHRMPSGAGPWAALFVMGGLNNLIPFSLILCSGARRKSPAAWPPSSTPRRPFSPSSSPMSSQATRR